MPATVAVIDLSQARRTRLRTAALEVDLPWTEHRWLPCLRRSWARAGMPGLVKTVNGPGNRVDLAAHEDTALAAPGPDAAARAL